MDRTFAVQVNYRTSPCWNPTKFTQSWEDPRIDQELFKFNGDDVIVTLTSAGDQVLDYLLASPKKVISVDLNERQNALLELKLASIRELTYDEFFAIFASSDGDVFKSNYQSKLRKHLTPKGKAFWDANLTIFDNRFFWSGACGNLVRYGMIAMRYLFGLNGLLDEVEHCESLEKQKQVVEQYRSRLEFLYWFMHQTRRLWAPFIAVPASQLDLYEGNIMKEALDSILSKTHLASDNYFFFGQLYGYWTKESCPRYLKEEHWSTLVQNVDRVEVHHATLAQVISKCPDQSITCMSLLDHMDWMSDEIILDCFKVYVKKLAPRARIFWRSFSDFQHIAPLQYLHFHQKEVEQVIEEYPDRVMMYKKTFFATVPDNFDVLPRHQYAPRATCMQDLSVLFNMYVKPISGDDHKARLDSFYAGQKDDYDVFRHRFLHGRWPMACAMPSPKNAVWVDIGGGTGSNLEFFGKDGIKNFDQVYILDLCGPLLEVAEQRVKENGWEDKVTCVLGDACDQSQDGQEGKLPAAGTVDVITFSYSLTMIPDWKAAIEHAYNLLKPGGIIAVGDFTVTKQHSYFTQSLWPAIFSLDGIKLNTEHIPHLETTFRRLACKVRRGGFPYLGWIPFSQCPFYHFVGQKPGGRVLGPNGGTDRIPPLDVE